MGSRLDPYAEDLAAHTLLKRNKITPEIEAEVVQRRRKGQQVDAIATEIDLVRISVWLPASLIDGFYDRKNLI